MFLDNLVIKIASLMGMFIGIELIAIGIFTLSVLYFRSPVMAGVLANLSSLGMFLGVLFVSVITEMRKATKNN